MEICIFGAKRMKRKIVGMLVFMLVLTSIFSLTGTLRTSAARDGEPTFVYETIITGYYLASGRGIVVDPNGNAYVIARTIGNENDILLVKLDANGTVLWETYIDGNEHDYANDIVLNDANDVYITGWTDSDDFPITPDALDSTLTHREAFVMKLSKADGAILYSTYLGGDYTDAGYGLTLNDAGEIYVVGSTGSTDFPTTEDAYQGEPSAPLFRRLQR
jgi:hypothetical protein